MIQTFLLQYKEVLLSFVFGFIIASLRSNIYKQLSYVIVMHNIVSTKIRMLLRGENSEVVELICYHLLLEHISFIIWKRKEIGSELKELIEYKINDDRRKNVLKAYMHSVADILRKEVARVYIFYGSMSRIVKKIENLIIEDN